MGVCLRACLCLRACACVRVCLRACAHVNVFVCVHVYMCVSVGAENNITRFAVYRILQVLFEKHNTTLAKIEMHG